MTSINFNVIRERCPDCEGDIMCHHKIMLCHACNDLYHASCSEKSFEFDYVKLAWICNGCKIAEDERYNPFVHSTNDRYDPSPDQGSDDLETVSNILKNCSKFDKNAVNSLFSNLTESKTSYISILFNNIDGNASNFDAFVADICQYKFKFDMCSCKNHR